MALLSNHAEGTYVYDLSAVIGPILALEQQIEAQTANRRFQTWLLGLFAGAALLLATAGLYGVISSLRCRPFFWGSASWPA